jgi:uncharacterized protein YndB with AHSA1/START domain
MPVDHDAKQTWASREIAADAATIFAVLVDPTLHSVIDGSGTVRGARGPRDQRLELGSKFGMDMRMGIPYRMPNTVVEFEQDHLIAWCHPGKHRWRWTIEPVGDGTHSLVTEGDRAGALPRTAPRQHRALARSPRRLRHPPRRRGVTLPVPT